jgi:hypothetical protein
MTRREEEEEEEGGGGRRRRKEEEEQERKRLKKLRRMCIRVRNVWGGVGRGAESLVWGSGFRLRFNKLHTVMCVCECACLCL